MAAPHETAHSLMERTASVDPLRAPSASGFRRRLPVGRSLIAASKRPVSIAVDAIAAFMKSNSPMPKPMAPTALACAAAGGTAVSADWQLARPLGVTVSGIDVVVTLQLVAFTAAVDVYLVIAIPNGQQFVVDAARRLLPFPANIVPLRANSLAALSSVSPPLISAPLAAIPPGSYSFIVVVVPAGTDPAGFNPASSSYYLWCFTWSF